MSGLKSSWELSLERSEKLVPELKNKKEITEEQKKKTELIDNKQALLSKVMFDNQTELQNRENKSDKTECSVWICPT